MVRVGDVARVELGAKSSDRFSTLNGKPAASVGIYLALAPTPSRSPTSRPRWPSSRRFPEDVDYDLVYDTSVFVTDTIDEVIKTLLEAFVLVAIVVFVFLGKLRTTLIPLVAVPVSIVGTFAVLLLVGYSANTVRCSPWCSPSALSSTTRSW